jgi:hypothetical protein
MRKNDPNALYFRLVEEATRKIIADAIIRTGSVRDAAEYLGITRAAISRRLNALGLSSDELKKQHVALRKAEETVRKAEVEPSGLPPPDTSHSWLDDVSTTEGWQDE